MSRKNHIDRKVLGTTIRNIRVSLGYSQVEFGKMVGYNQSSVSSLEKGSFLPEDDNLQKIATVLGTSVKVLLEGAVQQDFNNTSEYLDFLEQSNAIDSGIINTLREFVLRDKEKLIEAKEKDYDGLMQILKKQLKGL